MHSSMKKYWKALTNLGVALLVLVLVVFLLPKLLFFFLPFVVGWIIALIASPLVRFFEEKMKIRRKAGSAFVIIVVIALVVLALYLAGGRLINEIIDFVNELPDIWKKTETDFQEIGRNLSVIYDKLPVNIQQTLSRFSAQANTFAGELLGRMGSPTIAAVGNFAKQLPTVLIGIIMGLLSSYFFVADREQINSWCRSYMPHFLQEWYRLVRRSLVHSVGGYLKAQLKIEAWMYLLLLVGLSLLHVNFVFLIALGIAFLDLLPFFGTGTVMVPWALIKILSGDYKMAIGLLIIWGVGQLARQIIQPKIVGDSVGMPPIPTLFLLFIGYRLGGVLGMIVAVPIGLIFYTLYEEGAFETTKNSILILYRGINRFRHLEKEDLEELSADDRVEKPADDWKEKPADDWKEKPADDWREKPADDWKEKPADDWKEQHGEKDTHTCR